MNSTDDTNAAYRGSELSEELGRVVEAATVRAQQTADVFVLMVRYGHDYWAAHSTHRDLLSASRQAGSVGAEHGQEEWRIVAVRGLPVHVAPGEAA